ncbi:MAG: S24 family peptidase [Acidiferrobacterales bacterium]
MEDPDLRLQKTFGTRTGVPPSYISQVCSQKRNIGHEVARRIEGALGLPSGWMDTQRGSPAPATEPVPGLVPVRRVTLVRWEDIAHMAMSGRHRDAQKHRGGSSRLPASASKADHIYTVAAAGAHPYAVRVEGDAMFDRRTGDGVPSGAYLVVDPDLSPRAGDYVIVAYVNPQGETHATFRQLIAETGRRYFKPLNPQYPMEPESRTTRICGVAVRWEFGKDLRVAATSAPRLKRKR